jgi:hypothetical protein
LMGNQRCASCTAEGLMRLRQARTIHGGRSVEVIAPAAPHACGYPRSPVQAGADREPAAAIRAMLGEDCGRVSILALLALERCKRSMLMTPLCQVEGTCRVGAVGGRLLTERDNAECGMPTLRHKRLSWGSSVILPEWPPALAGLDPKRTFPPASATVSEPI